ncbi:uncharacterized protein K441DRAFT_555462, partial [Cenococcum geophilum 1.58]|uniref:uncharacterized protein n=1 Tax=Cenococcum geophilum 1.58 TaxID=794803 RepID=UPI00358F1BE0
MNPSLSSPSEVAPHSPETNAVPATGLTVLYQPVGGETIVDILFVHGLQGHPRATWSCKASRTSSERGSSTHLRVPSSDSFAFRSSPSPRHSVSTTALLEEPDQVFWPKDLLPKDCPEARIMTWGYDTIVTQGFSRPTTKSNIFAHAKDLLYALDRERAESRPIIFVCHSLGGIIVKEVLRRSQMSSEELIRDIVESTLAVLFLGTPHRGSAEFAALGDMMRRIGSVVLRLDSNATILRALGSDSPELELCRESFIAQWSRYNFHVKTFQEALGVTALNVVPDTSSSLDDPREHAETIPANHMDMARFTGADDPGYRKVSGELRRLRLCNTMAVRSNPISFPSRFQLTSEAAASLTAEQKGLTESDCLRSLTYVELGMREARIRAALSNTCEWLFENAQFQEWSLGRNSEVSHGMLWLKGKPGAGKSTLVKAALHRIGQRRVRDFILTGFFFNARGAELERTPLGLFRSFLHQILEQDELLLEWFCGIYKAKCDSHRTKWEWTEEELETLLKEALATKGMKPVWMFIDALDECDEAKARDLVFYFRELTDTAYEAGRNLRVCLSSRHYPTITVERCPEIVVEDANHDDISRYVHSKLQSQQFAHGPLISALQNAIVSKASGIFLWVVLVVGIVLRLLDEGKTTREIEAILQMVPQDLDLLFSSLLKGVNDNERAKSLALVRWVLLARCQLSINDAYLAIMFSSETPYTSFGSWPQLREIQVHPQQIMRLIRNLSKGLIEVSSKGVQFIHESVREFFIHGRGLTILENRSETSSIRSGHLTIIRSCLNHIYLEEL